MKFGTNFIEKETLILENVGFQFPQDIIMSPRRLFGGEEVPFYVSIYPLLHF
jgi:hypothetical protein